MSDLLVGAPSGRNHYISGNPKITRCGMFAAQGWGPENEGGAVCQKCITRGKPVHDTMRPLPNTFGGSRRP